MNASASNANQMKPLRGIEPPPIVTPIGPDRRQSVIAEAAYYLSEHRGFVPGHELEDWLAAEKQINASSGKLPTLA